MTDQIERPWALMRHHAGWADVFLIEKDKGKVWNSREVPQMNS